jgi:hypothetical protein
MSDFRRHVQRLAELSKIEDGWLDGGGKRPTDAAIAQAFRFIVENPSFYDGCGIFPTEIGGILIEGHDADSVYVEISPDGYEIIDDD